MAGAVEYFDNFTFYNSFYDNVCSAASVEENVFPVATSTQTLRLPDAIETHSAGQFKFNQDHNYTEYYNGGSAPFDSEMTELR